MVEYDFPDNAFTVWDWVVFVLIIVISVSIGFVFGCRNRKKSNTTEVYLLGGRKMPILPAAMSILVSFLSSITILGTAAETFWNGIMYTMNLVGIIFVTPVIAHLFLPVLYPLKIFTTNEYLEMRFHKHMRILTAIAYIWMMVIYLGVVLYGPSLAMGAVTGVDMWIIVWIVGISCTIYTAVGGMKAVMWTDTFQIVIMVASLLMVLIQGTIDHGGFYKIWYYMGEGGRLDYWHFDLSPTVRHTMWTQSIGAWFFSMALYTNQANFQRLLSVPTVNDAKKAQWINHFGLIAINLMVACIGAVLYAEYRNCDPLKAGRISSPDQVLPQYVMDRLHYAGLPGLFTAGLFSASLSTISSGLNSLAAVTIKDIVQFLPCEKISKLSDGQRTIISKILTVIYAICMIAMAYFASNLPSILQGAMAMLGMFMGPIFGVFMVGMLYPWVNAKGAAAGFIVSLVINMWFGFGAIVHRRSGPIPDTTLHGCPVKNITLFDDTTTPFMATMEISETTMLVDNATVPLVDTLSDEVWPIYRLSYMWPVTIAVAVLTVVSFIVSAITGFNKPGDVDPRLILPIVDKLCGCFPGSCRRKLWCGVKHDEKQIDKSGKDPEDIHDMTDANANDKQNTAGSAEGYANPAVITNDEIIINNGASCGKTYKDIVTIM